MTVMHIEELLTLGASVSELEDTTTTNDGVADFEQPAATSAPRQEAVTAKPLASAPTSSKSPWPVRASMTVTATAAASFGGFASAAPASLLESANRRMTAAEAVRLLQQGGFGANRAEIERVLALVAKPQESPKDPPPLTGSATAWLDEQLDMKPSITNLAWFFSKGWDGSTSFAPGSNGLDASVWRAFISNPDQLRQRMVFALSQILVVSSEGLDGERIGWMLAYYADVLNKHAFGNFRDLLEAVTLSPAMGQFLSMRGSQKADGSGRQPDENYAREIMQLFTIGLVKLHDNGTPDLDNGAEVDSYTEADVAGLAKVFTGWDYTKADTRRVGRFVNPMVNDAALHESGAKTFLGTTVPANTSAINSLRLALDVLFKHKNVPPFIGKQLIQRLVTSNPSKSYVAHVSRAFKDNGKGVRGDLSAVLRAILSHPEARNIRTSNPDADVGKLREPVLRFVSWARACNASSPKGDWGLRDLSDPGRRLGQSPFHASSVFNFYRPGYVPPNTAIASAGKVAPEFQITTETSVAGYLNYMQMAVANSTGLERSDIRADYSAWLPLANDPPRLAAEANLLLAANRLSAARVKVISDAITAMLSATEANRLSRVHAAVLLTLAAPECLVAN
jgi:uncharacterized protein (DUF1800 family)